VRHQAAALDEPHGVIESMNPELTVNSVRVNKLRLVSGGVNRAKPFEVASS
jgi:hypothetical protein